LVYQALKAEGLEYKGLGTGSGDVRTKRRGWQIGRVGSVEAYNTQYVEAEFEVLSGAFMQLETRETLDHIKELTDITSNLKARADQQNLNKFYEKLAADIRKQWQVKGLNGPFPTAAQIPGDRGLDPLYLDKLALANVLNELGTMAAKGQLTPGPQWSDVIDYLADQKGDAANAPMAEQSRLFDFLNHLVKENVAGAKQAKESIDYIRKHVRSIQSYLGDEFATPRDFKPEGYTEWKPAPGKNWHKAFSISDRLASAVLAGEEVLDESNSDKIHQILARGRDIVWIIPTGVAKTLDGFDKTVDPGDLSQYSRKSMNMWKRWTLMNPFRFIKYNLNNLSGDLDICFAFNYKIVTKYLWGSVVDLAKEYRGKTVPARVLDELETAHSLGVLDSGWSFVELSNVAGSLSAMDRMEALKGNKPNFIKRGWHRLQDFTRFRENMLRLAAFRFFRDEIAKGVSTYGASNAKEIDAIQDPDRRAAKLARELLGDYGNLSHAGQFIRSHMLPYYAWMEINAPRYVRLMRNLKHEGRRGTARLAAIFGKNIAWKSTKLGAKMAGFFIMTNLWNAAFFADEEDELGEAQREQLHLILGRRDDGSIISIRLQGAFSDALSYFGAEDIASDIRGLKLGKRSMWDVTKESLLATPKKIILAIRPDVKGLGEIISGRSWYPDPFNPRPIRDRLEYIARTFSLNTVYDWVTGKPKRGANVGEKLANDLLALGLYSADPGEMAYYSVLGLVDDYRKGQGKEQPAVVPTDKSNAMYYYKQALKYGDLKAAEKYLKKYLTPLSEGGLGGTYKGLEASIKRSHPLGGIAKKDWTAFTQTLSPKDRQTLAYGIKWYDQTYLGAGASAAKMGAAGGTRPATGAKGSGLSQQDALEMMRQQIK
jgi:hypothetical protein